MNPNLYARDPGVLLRSKLLFLRDGPFNIGGGEGARIFLTKIVSFLTGAKK